MSPLPPPQHRQGIQTHTEQPPDTSKWNESEFLKISGKNRENSFDSRDAIEVLLCTLELPNIGILGALKILLLLIYLGNLPWIGGSLHEIAPCRSETEFQPDFPKRTEEEDCESERINLWGFEMFQSIKLPVNWRCGRDGVVKQIPPQPPEEMEIFFSFSVSLYFLSVSLQKMSINNKY